MQVAVKRREPPTRAIYLRRRAVALIALLALVVGIAAVLGQITGSGSHRPGSSRPASSRARSSRPVAVRPSATDPRPRPPAHPSHARHAAARAHTPTPTDRPPPTRNGLAASLTLDQLAGQRIIYAYSGLTPPASLLDLVRAGEAAGVLLFSDNVSSFAQTRAAMAELQAAAQASPVRAPLLILTDQEGGQVRRLPGPPLLSQREVGDDAQALLAARESGAGAARTLRGAAVNVNLAPVLDVMRTTAGFVGWYGRSYSTDAQIVAELGGAFIAAQQHFGVAATAKHFPGLGAATRRQDTDSRPVTIPSPLGILRAVDEAPYRAAIAADVRLVMTSWATYPSLDPARPAGLSSRVIGGELRKRLGYRGVTITDTLSAGALTRYGSIATRGLLAARAGADLLICSAVSGADDPDDGLAVLHGLASALAHRELSRGAAERSATRVLALRHDLSASSGAG